jgi:hypothetical protein
MVNFLELFLAIMYLYIRVTKINTLLNCFSDNFPTPASSNCPLFVLPAVWECHLNTKNGQFELAGIRKLFEKQFI